MIVAVFASLIASSSTLDQASEVLRQRGKQWSACLVQAAKDYATGPDSPQTIADAALGTCAGYENDVKLALTAVHMTGYAGMPGGIGAMVDRSEAAAREQMQDVRTQMRNRLIGVVLSDRAERAAPAPQ